MSETQTTKITWQELAARMLLVYLLPDSPAAELWSASDVYAYLEADGYLWDGVKEDWISIDNFPYAPR